MSLGRSRRSTFRAVSISRRRGRSLLAFACSAMALAGAFNVLATRAWSDGIRSDNPAPSGQSYLTGDWGGLRSYLESHGVTLTLTDTTDVLANVSGGIKTGAAGLGAIQPQLDLDLQKLAGWQGGIVHVHGLVTYGPLFSANYLGNILAVSNIEAGPMARLYAFWYEQNGSNDLWSVRVGLMLADSQDRGQLHQQRHQLAGFSLRQPAGLGT